MAAQRYEYNGHTVLLERTEYVNGGLAVMMWEKGYETEDSCDWEPYADVTRWLFDVGDRQAFVDENNMPGIGQWLEDNGLATYTGIDMPSGYCMYPLYEFTDKFFSTSTDE